jgi:hypothetical protein
LWDADPGSPPLVAVGGFRDAGVWRGKNLQPEGFALEDFALGAGDASSAEIVPRPAMAGEDSGGAIKSQVQLRNSSARRSNTPAWPATVPPMLLSSSWAISLVDSGLLRRSNFASLSANSSIDRYHKETADGLLSVAISGPIGCWMMTA